MDARYQDVAAALKELPSDQPGRTLDLLARMLGLTDQAIAERTGGEMSRATINHKRSGRSPMRAADLWPLAEAVDATVDVLLLKPSAAAGWLVKHRTNRLDGGVLSSKGQQSRCMKPTGRPVIDEGGFTVGRVALAHVGTPVSRN